MTETSSSPPMKEAAERPSLVVENVFAPEIFASEASFFAQGGGIVSITLASYRWDASSTPSGAAKRIVIGRLVMPIKGAQTLVVGLYDFLRKAGLDPIPKPDPNAVQ